MKKILATTLLLPFIAVADPTSVTRRLTEEPATMMDIGILRLDRYLEGAMEATAPGIFASATNSSAPSVYSWAEYDVGEDRINVKVEFSAVSSSVPAKAGCLAVLSKLSRLIAGVVPGFFAHVGHHQSRDFEARFAARTAFHCSVTTKDSGLAFPVVNLQRGLPDGPIVDTTLESDYD